MKTNFDVCLVNVSQNRGCAMATLIVSINRMNLIVVSAKLQKFKGAIASGVWKIFTY